jgi:hypothetical protein
VPLWRARAETREVLRLPLGSVLGLLFSLVLAPSYAQSAPISEEAAHSIAVDAYIYFYPLLTMDVTRKQLTNGELVPAAGRGPMNIFVNVPAYPPADFKGVVRSNFDTLYSLAWLDLTKEPLVISAPDTDGRFYLLPMLDMWSDVFASPGWRTTGTKAGDFLVTPPGWTGAVPSGFMRLAAPTPYIWIIGRTKTDGAADYAAVHLLNRQNPALSKSLAHASPRVRRASPIVSPRQNAANSLSAFQG